MAGEEDAMAGKLVGAIEAGGTKFVCAVGRAPAAGADATPDATPDAAPDALLAETRFPTTTPDETLERAAGWLREAAARHGTLAALGIGSFGPVDVDPASPTWGHVTSTPKPGWQGAAFAPRLAAALGVPVGFDTDVNAAALGEWLWGAGRGTDTLVYVTVGTGIGGGAVLGGRPLHGLLHPEMGHVPVGRDPARDSFPGICPFHGDCLEGMASGPALAAHWGRPAEELPPDHEAWEREAAHLAAGLAAITCVLSPERIVLGGGVMETPGLLERVRDALHARLAGYLRAPRLAERAGLDEYLVPPGLGARAGVLGALALAARAAAVGTRGAD
ncbi:MAG: ROK family protein [Gemmatimonadota bacterium]|nr:ROK family protein [Gemmatimonadota bacterium]